MSEDVGLQIEEVSDIGSDFDRDSVCRLESEVAKISCAVGRVQRSIDDSILPVVRVAEVLLCVYAVHSIADAVMRGIARRVRRDIDDEE